MVDGRPVIFLKPLAPTDAEHVMERVGESTSEESGYEIALAVSSQAIAEARIDVRKTQEILKDLEESETEWTMVQPVYQDRTEDGGPPDTETRPANTSFWRAITKVLDPLRNGLDLSAD